MPGGLKHHGQPKNPPESLRPVFGDGLIIGVQVKRQPLVGVLEAGADAENALFGLGLIVAVQLVVGDLLKVIAIEPEPEILEDLVRCGEVGMDRLSGSEGGATLSPLPLSEKV